MESDSRRPIQARSSLWAQRTASWLATRSITPNQISVVSIVFAATGASLILYFRELFPWGLIGAVACIQARLICNLLDGMVAVEGKKKSILGPLFNEFPDRIADSLLIVSLGYAIHYEWLGWLGALLAALTAYIRVFGGALNLPQDFRGPMAKQHRMAVLSLGCLLGSVEYGYYETTWCLFVTALVIAIGSFITCVTRTLAIARQLKQNASLT